MTDANIGLVLIVVGVLALCAYAWIPRAATFRTLRRRMRWGVYLLLAVLAIAAIRNWEELLR